MTLKNSLLFVFFLGIFSAKGQNTYWVFLDEQAKSEVVSLSANRITERNSVGIGIDSKDRGLNKSVLNYYKSQSFVIKGYSRWLNALIIETNYPEELMELKHSTGIRKCRKYNFEPESISHNRSIQELDTSSYGIGWNQLAMLNGHKLHELGFTGKGMRIAVCDNGFINLDSIKAFDSLFQSNRILDHYNFVRSDSQVFREGNHGTNVLSTIAANWPDSIVGTAPHANYYLYVTEDGTSETLIEEYNWILAAERADSIGVDIITTSLGYTELYDDTINSHTYEDMDGNTTPITIASDIAASKGILVINSAGNSGSSDWRYIGAPADGDSVLAIGAVNSDGTFAPFSSRGPSYDGRIKPNVCAQGAYSALVRVDGALGYASGTSFSCPILAGVAACLWQAHPDKSNMDIFKAIEQSSHMYDSPDDDFGYGIPDFWKAHLILSDSLEVLTGNPDKEVWIENPYVNGLSVYVNGETNENVNMNLYTVSGQLIYSEELTIYNGFNQFSWSQIVPNNSSIYLLQIVLKDKQYHFKIVGK